MNWDIKKLKEKVRKAHGKPIYLALSPCLNSLIERQDFTRYHYHEAKYLLEKHINKDRNEKEIFQLVFAENGTQTEQFEYDKLRARAHITGCIQNLHSTSDILGHVIYYSLNLTNSKQDRDINLYNVNKWLDKNYQYQEIKNSLDRLINHQNYKYLAAISNYSKHRSIISVNLQFNLRKTGTEMTELVFPTFTHDRKTYPTTPAYQFLTSEFDRESRLVIEIGNKINQLLE